MRNGEPLCIFLVSRKIKLNLFKNILKYGAPYLDFDNNVILPAKFKPFMVEVSLKVVVQFIWQKVVANSTENLL